MAKSSVVRTKNKGVEAYPSEMASVTEDTSLPGELAPMEDAETAQAGYPQEPPPDEMPSMQEFVDNYTMPFQPLFEPSPAPKLKGSNYQGSGPPLTQNIGMRMANFLAARAIRGPKPEDQGAVEAKPVGAGAVLTRAPEALKQAVMMIGVASERNPAGLALSLDTARQIMLGKSQDDVSKTDEAEFRAGMEQGDVKIDKKRIRQFVNYDGSVTYEILNEDKSIMSRFTLGEYKGRKVFVQGGYAAYAQALRNLAPKLMAAEGGSEFDRIRKGG